GVSLGPLFSLKHDHLYDSAPPGTARRYSPVGRTFDAPGGNATANGHRPHPLAGGDKGFEAISMARKRAGTEECSGTRPRVCRRAGDPAGTSAEFREGNRGDDSHG